MLEAIIKRLKLFKSDKCGISNVLVVLLSLILVVVIVANVVLWNYQMNQFDWEKAQEKLEITNVSNKSPWFTCQTYERTWAIDNNYETFREEITLSPDSKTNAFIAYRDLATSLDIPKERTWNGEKASWSSQTEMPTAGSSVRFVRVAYCPLEQRNFEKIVATLSDDGYLDAYVWNGSSWVVRNNIAKVWNTAPSGAQRPYDIAYETASGRALLVYDIVVADATKDLGYKIWSPEAGWSIDYYIDFPGVASTNPTISFVELASNPDPTSNQIAMVFLDQTNQDSFAAIWNGSTWTLMTTLTTTVGSTSYTRESIGVAYSTYYKKVLAVSGNGTDSMTWKWYVQGEAVWRTGTAFDPDPDLSNHVCFITLKPDPAANTTHDYIMCAGVNSLYDLNAWTWNMAEETPERYHIVNEVDDAVDTYSQRCVDFAWEPTGNKGLIVWGTTAGYINYNTYSISAGWESSWITSALSAGTHPWVQLRTNPKNIDGDVKILGAFLNSYYNIGVIIWDGSTFNVVGDYVIAANTLGYNYECFELEFCHYGNAYRLSIGDFVLDVYQYPFMWIHSVEIHVRFWASDVFEDWFLKAYNWTNGQYEEIGRMPPAAAFNYYVVNLANTWQSYVNSNGTVKVKFCDAISDANQTTVDIDFFAVKIIFKGVLFNFKNDGTSTVHIVSIWIINATSHMRYDESLFINSGETMVHIREDMPLPDGNFTVKVVTERGNMAVFTSG
jgi:hypothetical protein